MEVMWIVIVLAVVVGIIALVMQSSAREGTAKELELTDIDNDWGLSREVLVEDNSDLFMRLQKRGKIGRLYWTHEGHRSGRAYLVAEESLGHGDDETKQFVVAGRTTSTAEFFTNADGPTGHVDPAVAEALEQARVRLDAWMALIGGGYVVIRCRDRQDYQGALDACDRVVTMLDDEPAALPEAPSTWEQPPRAEN